MKRLLPLLAFVLFVGCQEPQPEIAPDEAPHDDLAQIDEMGQAADGEEFIAHPPTGFQETTTQIVFNEMAKEQYKTSLTAWANTAKEEGRLTDEQHQTCIDKWAGMSKIELRKAWRSKEELLNPQGENEAEGSSQ